MFRNMVTSLFKHEQVRTTDVKAKELRRWADQLVTLAKQGDLHARRRAMAIIQEKDVVHKLFEEAPKRFAEVNGGYTRVVKVGIRPGDAASVSLVQLVSPEPKKKKKPRRKKKAVPAIETPAATGTKQTASEVEDLSEATAPKAAAEVAEAEQTAAPEASETPQEEPVEAQADSSPATEDEPNAAEQKAEADEKKEEK